MPSEHHDIRFGVLAVKKGLITPAQALEALETQFQEELFEDRHRRVGEILIAKGLLSSTQVKALLNELNKMRTFEKTYK